MPVDLDGDGITAAEATSRCTRALRRAEQTADVRPEAAGVLIEVAREYRHLADQLAGRERMGRTRPAAQ